MFRFFDLLLQWLTGFYLFDTLFFFASGLSKGGKQHYSGTFKEFVQWVLYLAKLEQVFSNIQTLCDRDLQVFCSVFHPIGCFAWQMDGEGCRCGSAGTWAFSQQQGARVAGGMLGVVEIG